jgi:ABC-type sugar transport system ATPase subunit
LIRNILIFLARPAGFEPATYGLEVRCSIQLSYGEASERSIRSSERKARLEDAPVASLRNIRKRFGATLVVDGVDLDLRPGEVHALVGENGAGKSTLMRVLAGLDPDYEGEIFLSHIGSAAPIRIKSPRQARKLGIALAHQELSLVPELSAAENIFLGDEPRAAVPGFIARQRLRDEARRVLAGMGVELDVGLKVSELSVARRQLVEIAKGLAGNPRVLILDEPTGSLTAREAADLFAVIGRLRAQGAAIVYISHKLDEVFAIADRLTVLRDGRVAAGDTIDKWDEPALVRAMVGREIATYFPHEHRPRPDDTALEVRGLGRPGAFSDVSFTLRRGEVLGIYGLIGAGRSELAEALFGLRPARNGELMVFGEPVRVRSPRQAMALGIALAPEDRRGRGLCLLHSVAHNLSLPALSGLAAHGFIRRGQEHAAVLESMRALAIHAASPQAPAGTLSGGNQQKIVLGKWLLTQPRILILDEPTRGIDVGAKAEIHGLIDRLAGEGLAIILISSELPEVMGMSDRILVMRAGRIAAEFGGPGVTAEALGAAAAGIGGHAQGSAA